MFAMRRLRWSVILLLGACATPPVPRLDSAAVREGEEFDSHLTAALAGDAEGLYRVGISLQWSGVPDKSELARQYLEAAKAKGHPDAEEALSPFPRSAADRQFLAASYGWGSKDPTNWTLVEAAADAGSLLAQDALAEAYEERPAGIAWLRKRAADGDPHAQLNLGNAYAFGRGVPKDEERALRSYLAAATTEYMRPHGLLEAARLHLRRAGSPVDRRTAIQLLRRAVPYCERGDAAALAELGQVLVEDAATPDELAQGVLWLRRGALAGFSSNLRKFYLSSTATTAESELHRGECYETILGNDYGNQSLATAARHYRSAAAQGSAEAAHNLGRILFLYGARLEMDVATARAEAVGLLSRAAEKGYAPSQCALGLMHTTWWREEHRAVKRNPATAVRWLRAAAESGHPSAQSALGRCYESGYGVWRSKNRALYWYAKAAKERKQFGAPEPDYLINLDPRRAALTAIGRLTTDGSESGERLRWGIQSLRVAFSEYASGDSAPECAYLFGELYRTGRGVPQSTEIANAWYRRAASGYWEPAQERLREMQLER